MAIKKKETEKKSKLLEILQTEYRGESLLLGILATLTAALAVMIIGNVQGFSIPSDFPILGGSPNDMIFAWTILIVALLGLSLVIYPFFIPTIPELKKIQWGNFKTFLDHSVRVLIFIAIVTLLVASLDIIILRVIEVIG